MCGYPARAAALELPNDEWSPWIRSVTQAGPVEGESSASTPCFRIAPSIPPLATRFVFSFARWYAGSLSGPIASDSSRMSCPNQRSSRSALSELNRMTSASVLTATSGPRPAR